MKPSELSFADMAAVEILPALVKHFGYLGQHPEAQAAREAYKLADALSAERDKRNDLQQKIVDSLRRRVERAEASYSMLLNRDADAPARIALTEIWELLGVRDQTAAMAVLRSILPLTGN